MKSFAEILAVTLCAITFCGFVHCNFQVEEGSNSCDQVEEGRFVKVYTNNPDAQFILVDRNQTQSWGGQGQEFTFGKLKGKDYTLIFYSEDPTQLIPPESKHITFLGDCDAHTTIIGKYQAAGQLNIECNYPQYHVQIKSRNSQKPPIKSDISDYNTTMFLPEGSYEITFSPLIQGHRTLNSNPIEIKVTQNQETIVQANYS